MSSENLKGNELEIEQMDKVSGGKRTRKNTYPRTTDGRLEKSFEKETDCGIERVHEICIDCASSEYAVWDVFATRYKMHLWGVPDIPGDYFTLSWIIDRNWKVGNKNEYRKQKSESA